MGKDNCKSIPCHDSWRSHYIIAVYLRCPTREGLIATLVNFVYASLCRDKDPGSEKEFLQVLHNLPIGQICPIQNSLVDIETKPTEKTWHRNSNTVYCNTVPIL